MISKIKHFYYSSDRKSRILYKNVVFSFIVKGLAILVSLITLPAYMNYFPNSNILGLWFTAISILSWLFTFDLGIGNGLRNHLVEPITKNDTEEIYKYISSAYITIGFIVSLLLIVSYFVVPFINWNIIFNVSDSIISSKTMVFVVNLLIFGMLIQFLLKLVTSILYSMQKSALIGVINLISSLLMLCFTLYFRFQSDEMSLKMLSIMYIFTTNTPYILISFFVFKYSLKGIWPKFKYFSLDYSKRIIKLGSTFFYLQILTMFMFGTNEFLISKFINPADVVIYQIYNRLFSLIGTFFNLAISPVWSAVTQAIVTNDLNWVKRLNHKLNFMVLILIPIQIFILLNMQYLFDLWLGKNTIKASLGFGLIYALYNLLFMKMSVDTNIIAGFGKLRIQTISLTITTILKMFLSILLVYYYNSWIVIVIASVISLIPYLIIEHFDISMKLNKEVNT